MDLKNKYTGGFYFGKLGPWIPIILMVIGLIVGTKIGGGGILRFSLITFLAVIAGFFLAKDKKNFGNVAISGLTNSMLAIIIIAFLSAGVLGQLLRQSELIEALVHIAGSVNFDAGFLPLISFVICAIISTSCGTSSGSITAMAPVMLPLAVGMGCNPGLVCGAIISGAIFGDNLAPISDTTIGSALTQEAPVGDVVRTRLPYSLIAGGVSAVGFTVLGNVTTENGSMESVAIDADLKSLLLLILPVIMIFMIKKGFDLVATLLVCDAIGIILNVVLGTIDIATILSNEGPIVAGLAGMINLVMYCILLFILLEILNCSGAFDALVEGLTKNCKSARSAELVCMLGTAVGTAAAGGSSPAVLFFGPMVRKVTKDFKIERTRGANILDGTACGISSILPYGTPVMLCLGFTTEIGAIPADFGYFDIVPYSFHGILLLALFALSILTGIGRRYVKDGEE